MAYSISTRSSSTTSECLPPLPEQCVVGSWTVSGKEVVVVKEKEALLYYTNDSYRPEKKELSADQTKLYGIRRAINLIKIFHAVIQVNLADSINSLAFLPLLCTDGFVPKKIGDKVHYEPMPVQTALFGRRIYLDGKSEAVGVRWGIYNPVGRVVHHFEDTDAEKVAKCFICKVPYTSAKEEDYASYVKRFRPIITHSSSGEIESIFLRCYSVYDKNIMFSEHHWVTTVISVKTRSGVGTPISHAMMACEGLNEGVIFLKLAHITTRAVDENQQQSGARVKLFSPDEKDKVKYTDLSNINKGPTWLRPKHLIEKMLQSIEDAQASRRPVRFSMVRDPLDSAKFLSLSTNYTFSPITVLTSLLSMVFFANCVTNRNLLVSSYEASLYAIHQHLISAGEFALRRNPPTIQDLMISNDNVDRFKKIFSCLSFISSIMCGIAYRYGKPNIDQIRNNPEAAHNCASWVREQLLEAGIRVNIPVTSITPNSMIECLKDERNVIFFNNA